MNPHQVTRDFEKAVAEYTGAPYCVAVNSCTNALFLSLMWFRKWTLDMGAELPTIEMPSRSYISVPMQAKHAGFEVTFRDYNWRGVYELKPTRIYDCARWFTAGLYEALGGFVCTSHHWSKTLGIQQGGCILHSSDAADKWFRRARFDGRTEAVPPIEDDFDFCGWHMYLSPEVAAEGLVRLAFLPRHNEPLPNDNYPDLSKLRIFGNSCPKPLAEAAE